MGWKCVLICLLSSAYLGQTTPTTGVCPKPPPFDTDFCSRASFIPSCRTDSDCQSDGKKCCPAGRCHIPACETPLREQIPGCPVDNRVCVQYQQLCDKDSDCGQGEQCCYNPSCGTSCQKSVPVTDSKPGVCPAPIPYSSACDGPTLFNGCADDSNCQGDKKCCLRQCNALQCQDPLINRPECPTNIICKRYQELCKSDADCGKDEVCCYSPSCGRFCRQKQNSNCRRICNLPKKVGPCEALIPRYYYNKSTKNCEQFNYGGCKGNKNNFETKEECEQKCGTVGQSFTCPSSVPCPPGVPVFNCLVAPCSTATCPNYPSATCCNNYCGGCNAVFYNNGNILTSEQCGSAQNFVCPSGTDCPYGVSIASCIAPPCLRATCPNYPSATCCDNYCGGCHAVFYNNGNILTNEQCRSECPMIKCLVPCPNGYKKDKNGCQTCDCIECPKIKCSATCPNGYKKDEKGCQTCECIDICQLPAETGRCKAFIPSYYYNATTKSCQKFIYGGCGGNANRFSTLEECRKACVPAPVCGPVCLIFCPFGNVLDDKGCPTCTCKTGCPKNAEPLAQVTCEDGKQRCPGGYNCVTPENESKGVCCKKECPFLQCFTWMKCGSGFEEDENGCAICKCKTVVCPQLLCVSPCPNGYKKDKDGCQTCQCIGVDKKPGTCPKNTANPDLACPAFIRPGDCVTDANCPKNQKCCTQGCSRVCQDPEPTACPTCCGPPPCCSSCIQCDPGTTFTGQFCNINGSTCNKGETCKTMSDAGSHGICCATNY